MKAFKRNDLSASSALVNDEQGVPEIHLTITTSLPVDRPFVAGWVLSDSPRGRRIASRLTRACNEGVMFKGYEILRDVKGQTYVQATQAAFFHGRHMNASLSSVGV